MLRKLIGLAAVCALVTASVPTDEKSSPAQEKISSELQALADAERAFARAATVKGIRDSFLEFFADDAIALRPSAVSAKERLRAQPARPFSEQELTWEPRTGDIAASGELGWLTGPSTYIDRTTKDAKPGYGNYLSVWRKQPDGQWRVFIDVGSNTPEPVSFAPGFVRFPFTAHYTGKEGKSAATKALTDADRTLNERLAKDTQAAYADVLTQASRLHRSGVTTIVGADSIRTWLGATAGSMSATTTTAESSTSGDCGYSYGLYDVKGAASESGAYLRVWTRGRGGKWWIVADVTQPVRQ